MGKHIDKEIVEKIPILYDQLKSKAAVARELGISTNTVTKYLVAYECGEIIEKNKPRVKITEEIIEKINQFYTETKNMSEVARRLGISTTTVKNHLNEENLKIISQQNDDRDALWYYIYRLFGPSNDTKPVSDWNITQMSKFKNQGYTYKGQLLTLKYFFEIKKSDLKKANGSIGIIPFVYSDAQKYYQNIEDKQNQIEEAIKEQLAKDRIEIQYNPNDYIGRKKNKKKIDLDTI